MRGNQNIHEIELHQAELPDDPADVLRAHPSRGRGRSKPWAASAMRRASDKESYRILTKFLLKTIV